MFTQMLVRYIDGTEGMIDSPCLEELISQGKISHFRRSVGWVSVEEAAIRGTSSIKYIGHERRRDMLSRSRRSGR